MIFMTLLLDFSHSYSIFTLLFNFSHSYSIFHTPIQFCTLLFNFHTPIHSYSVFHTPIQTLTHTPLQNIALLNFSHSYSNSPSTFQFFTLLFKILRILAVITSHNMKLLRVSTSTFSLYTCSAYWDNWEIWRYFSGL